jgi:hypothetical protein
VFDVGVRYKRKIAMCPRCGNFTCLERAGHDLSPRHEWGVPRQAHKYLSLHFCVQFHTSVCSCTLRCAVYVYMCVVCVTSAAGSLCVYNESLEPEVVEIMLRTFNRAMFMAWTSPVSSLWSSNSSWGMQCVGWLGERLHLCNHTSMR